MLTAEVVHAEGARYAARVVLVPGLWAGAGAWRGFAGLLGHRGWESHLLDLRQVPGGLEVRGAAVAAYTTGLGAPAVLVGHDAGGITALAAAAHCRAAAVVLLAPLAPGSRASRALVYAPSCLVALLRGRPVSAPAGRRVALLCGELPEPSRSHVLRGLGPDDAAFVSEVVWGRVRLAPAVGVPALVVAGEHDPLLAPSDAGALAEALGAEIRVLVGAGHWPLAGPMWQGAVDLVHRWVVQTLGEPLLELHAETMAAREEEE